MSKDLRQDLAEVGAQRMEARRQANLTSTELAVLVRQAVKQGIPKTEIARLAQISRPALDTMLKQAPQRRR